MVYGKTFLPSIYKSNKDRDTINLESISLAYNEYTNRLSLLESCTNEEERSILEAQVQVLCEVSVKEIISKIKEAWFKIKKKFFEVINTIIEKLKPLLQKIEFTDQQGEKHNFYKILSDLNNSNKFISLKVANQVNEFCDRFCSDGNLKLYTLSLYSKEGKTKDIHEYKTVFKLEANKSSDKEIYATFTKTISDLIIPLDQRYMYLANRPIDNLTDEDQNKAEEFAEKLDYLKSLKYDITYERYIYRYRNVFNNIGKKAVSAIAGAEISANIKISDCKNVINNIVKDVYNTDSEHIIPGVQSSEATYKQFIENMAKKISDYDKKLNTALTKVEEFESKNKKQPEEKTTALSTHIDNDGRGGRVKSFHSAVNMIKDMLDYTTCMYNHLEANSMLLLKFSEDKIKQVVRLYRGFEAIIFKNGFADYRPATDIEMKTDKVNGGE